MNYSPIFLAAALVLSACSQITLKQPDGTEFSRTAFGTQLHIKSLKVAKSADSTAIVLEGADSDQTEAIKAAVDGAVEGASRALKP